MDNTVILRIVADNPSLLTALREVLDKHFSEDAVRPEMSNEQIGQITRARIDGLKKVGEAFKDIERHRSSPDAKDVPNPAR